MNTFLKALFFATFLLTAQTISASPQSDARFIADRILSSSEMALIEKQFRSWFVAVYAKPVLRDGIEISDAERFADLVPYKDIAPFVERARVDITELFLDSYNQNELAIIASFYRENKDATLERALEEPIRLEFEPVQERALQSTSLKVRSDEPIIAAFEELNTHPSNLNEVMENRGPNLLATSIAVPLKVVFVGSKYRSEIEQLERGLGNAITNTAINTDGIFDYANPTQKSALLRELAGSKKTGNIKFIRPPKKQVGLD